MGYESSVSLVYPCYTKEIYSLKYLHLQKKEYLKSLNFYFKL